MARTVLPHTQVGEGCFSGGGVVNYEKKWKKDNANNTNESKNDYGLQRKPDSLKTDRSEVKSLSRVRLFATP